LSGNIVARRYAGALFTVGKKAGADASQAYGKQLSDLAGALAQAPEAMRFFKNPVFSVEEKKAVLKQLIEKLGLTGAVANFANLLADKNRLASLQEIAADYKAMLDEASGIVSGKLVTAVALSDARKVELKEQLEKQTGKKLVLDYAADPEILGGLVLKIGDSVLDASLRAQLNILKETIKRGE
jgi:F-type H+-transporting ATPase subunit delta